MCLEESFRYRVSGQRTVSVSTSIVFTKLALMSKKVVLYTTSATGFLATKKYTTAIKNIFEAKGIKYEEVDCALDQNAARRDHMFRISGKKELPQVHCDDKYIGGYEEIENLVEEDQLLQVLK